MKQFLFIIAFILALFNPAYADQHKVFVDVNGLVCDFCARALEKVFSKREEVARIDVNLGEKNITIFFNQDRQIDDDTITMLVNDSGYSVVSIRREKGQIDE